MERRSSQYQRGVRTKNPRLISRPAQWHIAVLAIFFLAASLAASAKTTKTPSNVVRWDESNPECSASASDGMHRYSTSYETLKVTLAVYDNELQRSNRTAEHVFSVLVTINNRGTEPVHVSPHDIALELVEHHHTVMRGQYPDELARHMQDSSDELVYQSEKKLKKHPDEKDRVEYRLKAHEQLVARWQQFLSTEALRDSKIDSGRPEVTGWVFFSTRTKWLGSWKDKEDFVVRIPVGKRVFEFPLTLPQASMPVLRTRE